MRNLKKILAMALALVMSLSLVTIANASDFSDDADISYKEAVDVMTAIGVIDGKALPIIEIAPIQGFYDYKNKYQAGSTIETCPAKLSDSLTAQMQAYAEQVYVALGMQSYARIDFLTDEQENIYCLEANTLPGMTPTSLLPQEAAVLGMDFNDLCEKLIQVSLEKYENGGKKA